VVVHELLDLTKSWDDVPRDDQVDAEVHDAPEVERLHFTPGRCSAWAARKSSAIAVAMSRVSTAPSRTRAWMNLSRLRSRAASTTVSTHMNRVASVPATPAGNGGCAMARRPAPSATAGDSTMASGGRLGTWPVLGRFAE